MQLHAHLLWHATCVADKSTVWGVSVSDRVPGCCQRARCTRSS
jgi:hypothetical protein